jgi:cytoskeletal protein CcmA (bactofilin family)
MVRGPAAARGTNEGAEASVLGRGARVRGRIGGDGDLRIEGQVEGDVTVSGELTIEEGAAVDGDVSAAAVVVGGVLKGDVTARGVVAIRATAQVEGNLDLHGAEVSLDEGASFHGHIEAEFDLPAELTGHLSHVAHPVHAAGRSGRGR